MNVSFCAAKEGLVCCKDRIHDIQIAYSGNDIRIFNETIQFGIIGYLIVSVYFECLIEIIWGYPWSEAPVGGLQFSGVHSISAILRSPMVVVPHGCSGHQ